MVSSVARAKGFLLTRHTEIPGKIPYRNVGFWTNARTFLGRVCRGSDVAWAASLTTLLLSGSGRVMHPFLRIAWMRR